MEGLDDPADWLGGTFALIFARYANPLLLLSLLIAHKHKNKALAVLAAGFALALSARMITNIPYDDGGAKVLQTGWGYYV